MSVRPAAHIGYIDGLRGLAVLAVVCAHIALHAHLSGPLAHVAFEGAHAVDLFFVISGFCLAYPTLCRYRNADARPFDVAGYAVKRLVRICPPYYLAIAAFGIAVLVALVRGRTPLVMFPGPFDLIKHVLFIDGHTHLMNGSFWTLFVEFRWYFVFPLCLAIWLRSPRAFAAVGLAAVVLYTCTRARGLDFGTLPGFMLGIVAADIHAGARLEARVAALIRRLSPWLIPVAVAVGVAVEGHATIPGVDGNDVAFPFQPTIFAWQLAMFFVVVAAGTLPALRSALNLRALTAVGVVSYSIYLVHEPIVAAIVNKIHGPAGFAVAFAVPIAAGFAFWTIGEWPFTSGPFRVPLATALAAPIGKLFAFAGIPAAMALPSRPTLDPASTRTPGVQPIRFEAAPAVTSS